MHAQRPFKPFRWRYPKIAFLSGRQAPPKVPGRVGRGFLFLFVHVLSPPLFLWLAFLIRKEIEADEEVAVRTVTLVERENCAHEIVSII